MQYPEGIKESNKSEYLFNIFRVSCKDWEWVYTEDIRDILNRYSMHRQGIFSYSQIYDDLPSFWIDCLSLIGSEEQKAILAYRRTHGNKNS